MSTSCAQRKLWIINQYAVTPRGSGITRHHQLAQLLMPYGWDTEVFATSFNHYTGTQDPELSLLRPLQRLPEDGVMFNWIYSSHYNRNNWRRYWNAMLFSLELALFGSFRSSPQIVIGSSPHPMAAFGAFLLARRHRVPFVLEVRDLWPDQLIQMGLNNPAIIRPLRYLEQFLYNQANAIISLSTGITQGLQGKGVPSAKITLIPNIPKQRPVPSSTQRQHLRQQLGFDGKVVALYAGSHHPSYDLETIVDAARMSQCSPDLLWVLIGGGTEKRSLIERASGLSNLRFLDAAPQSTVHEIMAASDIGLLTRPALEIFMGTRPVKLLEYLSNSLPVVSTIPGETELILKQSGTGITTPPEDPSSLSVAVCSLAADRSRRQLMAASAYQYCANAHKRDNTPETLARLLDSIIEA